MNPVLETRQLVIAHRSQRVIDHLNLTLHAGDSLALLAAGGGGKSSLFRVLLHLSPPSHGEVRWFGRNPATTTARQVHLDRQRIGAVHQDGALFADLTVEENLRLPLEELAPLSTAHIARTVRFLLTVTGLTRCAHLRPAALSTLMVRQCALARALVMGPELLICDDILAGLDPAAQERIYRTIRALHLERGRAALFLSHNVALAARLASELVVLDEGKLVAQGNIEALQGSDIPVVRRLLGVA